MNSNLSIAFQAFVRYMLASSSADKILFILYLEYILLTLIVLIRENGFTLKKIRNRQYPAENMMDTNYADDQALLTKHQSNYIYCIAKSKQQEVWTST